MSDRIEAAGGVVVRRRSGRPEVALVHRPKYDDWSLPKGKLEGEESHRGAALREVREETGLACRVGLELPSISYRTSEGLPKVVRYWWMEPVDGTGLRPSGEIDAAEWISLAEAPARLSHDLDRSVLDAVASLDAPAALVRHAKAGSRSAWTGDDRLRPLSKAGRRQAKALLGVFAGRPVARILSSPARRCIETVQPLALERSRPIETTEVLAEGAPLHGLLALLDELADTPTVLCAHGDLIPVTVEHLLDTGATLASEAGWKKASTWWLEREAGAIVRARHAEPPDVDGAPARHRPRGGR